MWQCPKCGREVQEGYICPDCRFDESKNYARYTSLVELSPAVILQYEKDRAAGNGKGLLSRLFGGKKTEPGAGQAEAKGPAPEKEPAGNAAPTGEEPARALPVGSTVTFGTFPQTKSHVWTALEWLVLAQKEKKVLLVSKYALDCLPFLPQGQRGTWRDSLLRHWLNGSPEGGLEESFLGTAFTDAERARLVKTATTADTSDLVFLLSYAEVVKYLGQDKAKRQCRPTSLAKSEGTRISPEGFCAWWLRSSGLRHDLASIVDTSGNVYSDGISVNRENIGIRPAVWIRV